MWYPIRLKPIYKDYLWGGQKTARHFHRSLPPGIYAESWEVSDRPEGMSVVINGPLAGKTLHELVENMGADLLGASVRADVFPLLIKIIDARETLSVQVHPDDESAEKYGGEPKTEMWYVLDAEPDAKIYCGLKPGVDQPQLERALKQNKLPELLTTIPAQRGDAIYVRGGRVHAIGSGCLLLEVQQNSNTTYRLYDWDRVGPDGKPRQLHIQESLQVIRWNDSENPKVVQHKVGDAGKNEHWDVLTSPYFKMERFNLFDSQEFTNDGKSFHVLFIASGTALVKSESASENLSAGSTCLMPAALSRYRIEPSNTAQLIRVSVP